MRGIPVHTVMVAKVVVLAIAATAVSGCPGPPAPGPGEPGDNVVEIPVPAGKLEIYDLAFATDLTAFTHDPGDEKHPALSHDQKHLVYTRRGTASGARSEIFRVSIDSPGSGLQISSTAVEESYPSPFPTPGDGSRVLASHRVGTAGSGMLSIYTSKAAPVALAWKTKTGEIPSVFRAQVSPDGDLIVYATGDFGVEISDRYSRGSFKGNGDRAIYLRNVQDDEFSRGGISGLHPAFSPDGRFLAYSKAEGDRRIIKIKDLTTGEDGLATNNPDAYDICPAWTVDGKWIVFSRSEDGGYNLYMTSAESEGNTRKLVHGEGSNQLWPSCGSFGAVYFQTDHTGDSDIWRILLVSP